MQPVIVHISNDYPDAYAPEKTRAIYHLVQGTPEFRHVVYSLNRVNGWAGFKTAPFGKDCTQIIYKALPKGFFWERRLREIAAWIEEDLQRKQIVPDVIEAHKFTVEGIVAYALSKRLGCRFICDIQGDTDTKILRIKRGARKLYRQIAQEASLVFPFAPWNVPVFSRLVGLKPEKCMLLPVISGVDDLQAAPYINEEAFVSIFHLKSWQRKNLPNLVKAVNLLARKRPSIRLDVYGAGEEQVLQDIKAFLATHDPEGRVQLKGVISHGAMAEVMQQYAAFAMPSKTESYGMVYAEALFSGLPVMYSKGQGIDGYFNTGGIGYAANAASVEDIAHGLEHLLLHQRQLKQNIAQMQAGGELDIIRKQNILDTYRTGICKVLEMRRAET